MNKSLLQEQIKVVLQCLFDVQAYPCRKFEMEFGLDGKQTFSDSLTVPGRHEVKDAANILDVFCCRALLGVSCFSDFVK